MTILSEREREIINLAYLSNEEIGERLNISRWTVQRHFADLFAKTGTNNRTELYKKFRNDALTDSEVIAIIRAYANSQEKLNLIKKIIEGKVQ